MSLHRLRSDLYYFFTNSIISHIPSWIIRKNIYQLMGLKIGKGSRIGLRTKLVNPCNITIGKNTIINEECFLDGRGKIMIGDNCSISNATVILTASHYPDSSTFEYYEKGVVIKNNVWIGTRAMVLDGSTINDFTILGANAVIKGVTHEKGIYIGSPARLLRYREIDKKYNINYRAYFR